jgi:hypothetical protein
MTDEEVQSLLQSALPHLNEEMPSRDLWPEITALIDSRPRPHWIDIALAVGVAALLAVVPQWFFVLAYHL